MIIHPYRLAREAREHAILIDRMERECERAHKKRIAEEIEAIVRHFVRRAESERKTLAEVGQERHAAWARLRGTNAARRLHREWLAKWEAPHE